MHYNVVRTLWSETSKHQRQGGVLYRADLSVLMINMCVSVRDVCVCVYDIIFQQSVCLSVFPLARLHGQTFGKKFFLATPYPRANGAAVLWTIMAKIKTTGEN